MTIENSPTQEMTDPLHIPVDEEGPTSLIIKLAEVQPKPETGALMIKRMPAYNTKAGIRASLNSLQQFQDLLRARFQASFGCNAEWLESFIVLGYYLLAKDGTIWRAPKPILGVPEVMTRREFQDRHPRRLKEFSILVKTNFPTSQACCPHCGRGWNLLDAYNHVMVMGRKNLRLTRWAGMDMSQLKLVLREQPDAEYEFSPAIAWDDEPPNELSKEQIRDDNYVIQPGDRGSFSTRTYFHPDCHLSHLRNRLKRQWRRFFEQAGWGEIVLHTRNHPEPRREHRLGPWFLAQTPLGEIQVGEAYHGLTVDWTPIHPPYQPPPTLFPENDLIEGGVSADDEKTLIRHLSTLRIFLKTIQE